MAPLFIILILFSTFSTLAIFGATNPKQKRKYIIFAIFMWVLTTILANALLKK